EFDRLANGHGAQSWTENSLRTLEEHLASVAIARRALSMAIDRVALFPTRYDVAERARRALPARVARTSLGAGAPAPLPRLADSAAVEHTLHDYLGYADAVVAAAREHDQDVAFFWEYFIGHMGGIKPFSADERYLYGAERATRPEDVQYNFAMRDRIRAHLDSVRVPLIDPMPELRRYDGTVWIDYLHYTKNGNRFMAEVMYDRLKPLIYARAARVRAGASALAR
ncbi:MAG: hypothetical protein M3081_06265, partial [Gemmatimonadota bacterium]|nr:hypothetical protein [Gemmatimonadota bacterium]